MPGIRAACGGANGREMSSHFVVAAPGGANHSMEQTPLPAVAGGGGGGPGGGIIKNKKR